MCAKDLEERNIALNEDDDDTTPLDSGLDSDNIPTDDDDDEIPSNRYLSYFNQFNCSHDRQEENFDPTHNAALAFTSQITEDCVDEYDLLTSNREGAQRYNELINKSFIDFESKCQ